MIEGNGSIYKLNKSDMRTPNKNHLARKVQLSLKYPLIILLCLLMACEKDTFETSEDFNVSNQWENAKSIIAGSHDVGLSIQSAVVLLSFEKAEGLEEMNDLPDWLVPQQDEDVMTVILIEKERRVVGSYIGGGDAYRWYWNLWIVNTSQNLVWEEVFFGGSPPSTVSVGASQDQRTGSSPKDDCLEWIIANSQDDLFVKHVIESNFKEGSVHYSDFDGDNDIDVLGASRESYEIAWWENSGPNSFEKHLIDEYFNQADAIFAADIDSDNDIDVLGTGYAAGMSWWENNGMQQFTKHTIDEAFAAGSVHVADIDDDGDMDILCAHFADYKISWWKNDGSENFTEWPVANNDLFGLNSAYPIDIDKDGDIDILASASYEDEIKWWENNGSEIFTEKIVGDLSSTESIYPVDIDSDGDIDVLCASDDVVLLENNGSESFSKIVIEEEFNANTIYSADFNNDGKPDILCGGDFFGKKTAWWENQNSGNFQKHVIDNDNVTNSIHAVDIDNDNDIDILIASQSENTITLLENTSR